MRPNGGLWSVSTQDRFHLKSAEVMDFGRLKEHLDHLKFVYALLFLFTTHSFHFRVQHCADRFFGTLDISKERPGNDDRFSKNAEINRVSVKCP